MKPKIIQILRKLLSVLIVSQTFTLIMHLQCMFGENINIYILVIILRDISLVMKIYSPFTSSNVKFHVMLMLTALANSFSSPRGAWAFDE